MKIDGRTFGSTVHHLEKHKTDYTCRRDKENEFFDLHSLVPAKGLGLRNWKLKIWEVFGFGGLTF